MSTQPPIEDINVIVSRFQAWAGTQASVEVTNGVRELTYDEAIRSRQRPIRAEELPEAEKPASASPVKTKQQRTGKGAKPKKRAAAPRRTKHTQPKSAGAMRTFAAGAALEPPAFREALAEKVSIIPASPSVELVSGERRTTALSLRISCAEHGLLKKRASEANLSVSCYVRNCVFEVENLRAQLAQKMEDQHHAPVQIASTAFAFGFCARFIRRLFSGKTTSLAVRA
jgi:hypothetical protein